jgi:hypothetical protein
MRTYVRAGLTYPPSEIHKIVDRAVPEGDADRALRWAGVEEGQPRSSTGIDPPPRPAGRQAILARGLLILMCLITDVEPSLLNLKEIVDALDVIGRVRQMPDLTDAALEDLGRQLREREEDRPR